MKALPNDGAVVYLESRAMDLVDVRKKHMSHSNEQAYFMGKDDWYVTVKSFKHYGLTGNLTGWRVWLDKPTMEDMFNA